MAVYSCITSKAQKKVTAVSYVNKVQASGIKQQHSSKREYCNLALYNNANKRTALKKENICSNACLSAILDENSAETI